GHGLGCLPAHRAMGDERRLFDADHFHLRLVGISDESAIEHVGSAGNVGERAGNKAAGAGFRGCYLQVARARGIEDAVGGGDYFCVAHDALHGKRTVAVAMAAIPSPRPVKPSRSLVVAFTATRSMSIPAIAAIRPRMASRCGPTRGASH